MKTQKQIIKLSSSMKLQKLISQYGIEVVLNDLLSVSEVENNIKIELDDKHRIVKKLLLDLNYYNKKSKKKVVFKVNVNVTESHTYIIDKSYKIDDEDEISEIYNNLYDKFGEAVIEVEDFGWMDMFDMVVIN